MSVPLPDALCTDSRQNRARSRLGARISRIAADQYLARHLLWFGSNDEANAQAWSDWRTGRGGEPAAMKASILALASLVFGVGCGASDSSGLGAGGGSGVGAASGDGGMAGAGGTEGSGATAGTAGAGATPGTAGNAGGGGTPGVGTSGCGSPPPANGKHEVAHGGGQRSYQLHLPKGYNPSKPAALVMNFHGRTLTALGEAAAAQEFLSGLYAKGDAAGFIVVNPQGLTANGEQTWNAGLCCAADKGRDDVGYVDAVIAQLKQRLCIDEKRIYATGISNGGFMSHRLACERANVFAAVAPVAAYNTMTACNPSRAMPMISFNGTSDPLVNYGWSRDSNQAWVARNGCDPTPTQTFKNGDSHCDTFAGCQGGGQVVFCTVEGGGHTWPGGPGLFSVGLGKTTQDLSANGAMWDFFEKHTLP